MNLAALSSSDLRCVSTSATHSTVSARWICSCLESCGRAIVVSLSLIADAIPSVNVSTISSSEKLPKDLVSLVTPAG
jgi:hypothetical protein